MVTGTSTQMIAISNRSDAQKRADASRDNFFGGQYVPELFPGLQMNIWAVAAVVGAEDNHGNVLEAQPVVLIYTCEGDEDPHNADGSLNLQKCKLYALRRLWNYYKGYEFVSALTGNQSIETGYCTEDEAPTLAQWSRVKAAPIVSVPNFICPKNIQQGYGFTSEVILKREFVDVNTRRQKPLSTEDMADWIESEIAKAGGCLKLEVVGTDAMYRTIYRELGEPRYINYLKRR